MRIFAVSDIHIDYDTNAKWVAGLSHADYREDVLILAGDVTDTLPLLGWCLETLATRFKRVMFVPGNHDLWVRRQAGNKSSFEKFADVCDVVRASGACMSSHREADVVIIPLLGWYDHSFGVPSPELRSVWMDYHACRWPEGIDDAAVASYFFARNRVDSSVTAEKVITFSHFMPRIDLMPDYIPERERIVYPVLGSSDLDRQLRKHRSSIHVYGHSHVNRQVRIDGVAYVNNARGYPSETWISHRDLVCIHEH